MDKKYAINLIRELFENPFSKEKFTIFVKNLLNHIEDASFVYRGAYIPGIYQEDVKTIERIGKYQDVNEKQLDILIVTFLRDETLERARSLQRNIIAWYLNGGRGGKMKDAALVAFISPNNQDWRFSFVKMEYKYDSEAKKIKEFYTPAKRYSYLVGPHEASHTAQSMMIPVLLNDKINPTLEEIEAIFKIEKVTKEFFEKYKDLFLNLADQFKNNQEFEEKVVKEHGVNVADFVKKLMGQIVFLYFLQKKGWLGVKPGDKWGSGDKKFMHNLFHKEYCEYNNFYNDALEPLFYNTLNNRDRKNSSVINDQSYSPFFKCRIPYLNGGLFTPVYDWVKSKIFIDNKYFQDIFDVFDTFNFTVFESDPIEKEVAVDPEMLGKVFENLLEIIDRKSKGAFYTPREIVHYMCQESLINYLISQSGYPEKRIRDLMKSKDQEVGRTEKDRERIENTQDLKDVAETVNSLLKTVKICDPAVGSGAFPMGLLKEISSTRYFLNKHFLKKKNKNEILLTEYDIKKETLENCIYGVDIDPGAVEIARLRFWLALVVEHEIEEIEPLPNLDYKIMQGNSLIELLSPSLLAKNLDVNRNKIIEQLSVAKNEYFNLSDSLSKSNKREEINLLTRSIVNYDKEVQRDNIWQKIIDIRSQLNLFGKQKNEDQLTIGDITDKTISKELKDLYKIEDVSNSEHFEWHLNFNEVFEKGGFDIVIANPPYIKEYVSKKAFDGLRESPYYQGKMDLWYLFACYASELLKDNSGVLTLIAQNNWVTSHGASKMRNKVLKDTQILSLVDFGMYKIFEAGIQTMVMIFKKTNTLDTYTFDYRRIIGTNIAFENILAILKKEKSINIEYLTPIINKNLLIDKMLTFSNSKVGYILDKISNKMNFQLDPSREVAQGIVCPQDTLNKKNKEILGDGYNVGQGIFVINNSEKDNLNFDKEEIKLIKPFFTTSQLKKWYKSSNNEKWIIYTDSSFSKSKKIQQYPSIKTHLDKFKKIITSDNKPYGLHRARNEYFFEGSKIISLRKCQYPTFTYTDYDCYVSETFYIIKSERINLKYLVGLLNSRLISFWLRHKGKMQGNNYQIDKEPLISIPILNPTNEENNVLVNIVEKIITITRGADYTVNLNKQIIVKEHEKQIDQIVYELYELTEEEIKIVEEN